MKMNQMFPSNWLAKEDLASPVRAVIKTVTREEIKGDDGNELKTILAFQGNVKSMILNKTNAEFLVAEFGDDSDLWLGKTVELYVDPSVMFGGKRIGGVRLRAPAGAGDVWAWPRAVKEAANVGITEDALKIELKKAGLTGYDAKRDTPTVQKMIDEISGAGHGLDEPPPGEIPF